MAVSCENDNELSGSIRDGISWQAVQPTASQEISASRR
jgi:hypothetical protein